MQVTELSLDLDYVALGLSVPTKPVEFTGYILKNSAEYCANRLRPAVLVCPGGGYHFTSAREATPIAMEFLAAGIDAFVLHYSCAPDGVSFPTQLLQVLKAVQTIRENAEEWNIDPDKIVVCGFSAGGHLAASSGVFWNAEFLKKYGFSGELHKPNGLILAYPVITSGDQAHRGSFENLLQGQYTEEMLALTSVENQITEHTPPTFLWHTFTDTGVPPQNSLLFASALAAHKVPFELHIYPEGSHGLSLANALVCGEAGILPKVQTWMNFAKSWIQEL